LQLQDQMFVYGEQGAMYRSANSGGAFEEVPTPSHGTYFGAVACGSGCLLAYGLRGNAYRSADKGQSWQPVKLPPVTLTAGLQLRNGTVVLSNEAGQVLLSRDDGQTFNKVDQQPANSMVSLLESSSGQLISAGMRNMISIDLRPKSPQEASK